jgi:hypothetical protein
MQMEAELREMLLGHICVDVLNREESDDWVFSFDGNRSLSAACPRRIIAEQRIVLGDEDDGHQFGLPEPLDGRKRAMNHLGNRAICGVRTRDDSGDLCVEFEGGNLLEIFNSSAGYEGWQCSTFELSIIGVGGGKIVVWQTPPEQTAALAKMVGNQQHQSDECKREAR